MGPGIVASLGHATRARTSARPDRPPAPTRRAIGDIAAGHPQATVVVVSHNGLLTSFLAQAIDGVPWTWASHDLGHCAIVEVEVDGHAARLIQRRACAAVD